jgi:hypothetical protein
VELSRQLVQPKVLSLSPPEPAGSTDRGSSSSSRCRDDGDAATVDHLEYGDQWRWKRDVRYLLAVHWPLRIALSGISPTPSVQCKSSVAQSRMLYLVSPGPYLPVCSLAPDHPSMHPYPQIRTGPGRGPWALTRLAAPLGRRIPRIAALGVYIFLTLDPIPSAPQSRRLLHSAPASHPARLSCRLKVQARQDTHPRESYAVHSRKDAPFSADW